MRTTNGCTPRQRGLIEALHVPALIGATAVLNALCASAGVGQSPDRAQAAGAGRSNGWTPTAVEVEVEAGAFVTFPPESFGGGCDRRVVAVGGAVRYWASSFIGLEGGLSTLGEASMSCTDIVAAPLPPDQPYTRTYYVDGRLGTSSFVTTAGALVEPFRGAPATPRVRFALGRMWDRGLGFRVVGAGVRYQFGRHALVMGIDRWSMTIDTRTEVRVLRTTGQVELLSSEPTASDEKAYFARVAWTLGIGR